MSAKLYAVEETKETRTSQIDTAFGCPRNFLGNRFVYVVISPRARGLSIGVNMNPDKLCNFDCVYCEVNRDVPAAESDLDVSVMANELEKMLFLVQSGGIHRMAGYRKVGPELLRLRHVAISGDGEPTLCPKFVEAVQAVAHVRARQSHPYFKLVLITNGTGLDLPAIQEGLRSFTREDEIWVKLDAGTQAYMDRVNRSEVSLEKVLDNASLIGRKRPIIIQSLFSLMAGEEPPVEEIDRYIERLRKLAEGGAMISLVQIYSATRPAPHSICEHLPLKCLASIRQRIKTEAGLNAEIF